jgi:hypothetical protein
MATYSLHYIKNLDAHTKIMFEKPIASLLSALSRQAREIEAIKEAKYDLSICKEKIANRLNDLADYDNYMVQSIGEEIRVLVITKRNIEKDLLDLEAELLEIETVELPIYTQGFNNAQKDHYERMQISRENYAYEAKCKEIQEEIDKLEAISKKIKAKALRNSRSTKPTPSKKTKKEKLEERATQILVNLYCGRPSNYVSTI